MLLRYLLCLLSMLQLVVLSGMVAAYFYGISNPQPPTPQTTSSEPPVHDTLIENEGAEPSNVKSAMRMKAISLSYLRENIPRVTTPLDLVRLFTDSDVEEHHLNRWISRTVRSATHSKGYELHPSHGRHKNKGGTTNLPGKYSVNKMSTQEGGSVNEHFVSIDAVGMREKEVADAIDEVDSREVENNDYFLDYPQDEPSEEDLEAFEAALHHMEEMSTCSSSKCQHPTPFVLNVRDPHDRTRMFIPECVVLHRCMNYTGCCGDGNHECVPKSMSIVSKAFLMVNRLSSHEDYVTFHPNMATTISFVNHTECECREKPKLPKCTKTCPRPFRLTQEGVHCICDCFPLAGVDNWPCESIKEGVVPVSHDGLVCITNGSCYFPRCTVGEFDIETGLCPLSDDYSLPGFLFENPNERRFYREHLRSFDFSSPYGRITVPPNDSKISPTPSSSSGTLAQNKDKWDTLESLTSQSILAESSTIIEPVKVINSSEHPSQVALNFSQQTTAHLSENFSAVSDHYSNNPEPGLSLNKSAHELQSSTDNSYDNVKDVDESDDMYDDYYSNEQFSPEDLTDNQSKQDSTSQAEAESTKTVENVEGNSKTAFHVTASETFSGESVDSGETSSESESRKYMLTDTVTELASSDQDETDTPSFDIDRHSHKRSSSKDQMRDDFVRQIALKSSSNHFFQIGSQFDQHFQSDGGMHGGQTHSREIHSGENFMKHLPTDSSKISWLYSSTSSATPLPQISSSSSELSSSSPQASSSLLTSLLQFSSTTNHPVNKDSKRSTGAVHNAQEHTERSSDKSLLKRLYSSSHDALTDGHQHQQNT